MRRLSFLLLIVGSCGSICPNDTSETRPAMAGTYFLGMDRATCINELVKPASTDAEQHQLTLSPDGRTVTETFVRDGKSYVVTYDVTSIHWATL